MIVVTGAPRTGTSMMMQTLLNLGYKTPAPKFSDVTKTIKEYNVKGFYETDLKEREWGVKHHNYKGQAIKLFPGELWYTNPSFVDKIIVCKRKKKDTLKSYKEVHKILKQEYTPGKIYDLCYGIIDNIIAEKPHIFINFEDINSKPKEIILSLCEFLGVNPSEEKINNSVKNIDYASTSSRSRNISS